MDDESLIEHLDLLADKLGVEVRSEAFGVPDGFCVIRGRNVLFVNRDSPPGERVDVMAAALATLDLDSVYIVPEVRAFLERYRHG